MPFKRYILEDMVEANLKVELPPMPEADAEPANWELYRRHAKENAVEALVKLMARSGEIRNETRFIKEMVQREQASSSAIGGGVALPHLRSMRPRKLVVAVARSIEGLEYDAPDGKPVNLFFCITAPPYDDKAYLRFYKWVGTELLSEPWLKEALMTAADSHEMVRILRGLYY